MFVKDMDCTKDTPIILGNADMPIYGKGVRIRPRIDGRRDSEHFKKRYLSELLPLEEYDLIVVLLSGGKDSIACFYKLIELGVPREKIELWHHDIDGGHPSRRMDWRCTGNYVKALAEAEGVRLRVSYREKEKPLQRPGTVQAGLRPYLLSGNGNPCADKSLISFHIRAGHDQGSAVRYSHTDGWLPAARQSGHTVSAAFPFFPAGWPNAP